MVDDLGGDNVAHVLFVAELIEDAPCGSSACERHINTVAQVGDDSCRVGDDKSPSDNRLHDSSFLVM